MARDTETRFAAIATNRQAPGTLYHVLADLECGIALQAAPR